MQKKIKNKTPLGNFTYGDVVALLSRLLHDAGHETPLLDAELILFAVSKKRRLDYYLCRHEIMSADEVEAYFLLGRRRLCHEPMAYILGHKEFFGHEFVVHEACLIPRPDTEIIIEQCLEILEHNDMLLDLCTGSGAIAITLLKERPGTRAVATDISPAALAVAKKNAEKLGVLDRLTFLEGDLFSAFPSAQQFSLMVSNPPYIPSRDIPTLSSTVRDYEPHLALDGDEDGLKFYRRILQEAPQFLKPLGHLVVEIGFDQAPAILGMLKEPWRLVRVVKDLGNQDRCIVLQFITHGEKS